MPSILTRRARLRSRLGQTRARLLKSKSEIHSSVIAKYKTIQSSITWNKLKNHCPSLEQQSFVSIRDLATSMLKYHLMYSLQQLKIGRHVLWDSFNVRSQGFCSASLLRADMREFRRACTFWCVSARRSNFEQNPWLRTLGLSQRTCLPIFSLNG